MAACGCGALLAIATEVSVTGTGPGAFQASGAPWARLASTCERYVVGEIRTSPEIIRFATARAVTRYGRMFCAPSLRTKSAPWAITMVPTQLAAVVASALIAILP